MNSVLKHQFRVAIDSRKEGSFNDFVNEIFVKRFGGAFSPVKQKHDKGCDGILDNDTIIAAYAPQKPNLRSFKKKAGDDFYSYKNNWQSNHPKWSYVYNGEYTAEMVQYLKSLKNDVILTDINCLIDLVEQLTHFKRRELASSLGIDEVLIVNDIMLAVVEDLFKMASDYEGEAHPHEPPPYIEDKIAKNYTFSEVKEALKEYEFVMEYFPQLKDVLKSYESHEISALKTKLINCYNKYSGDFKTRLENLIEEFSKNNKDDDSYSFFVRVVLFYFFETCVIGQRPESEK